MKGGGFGMPSQVSGDLGPAMALNKITGPLPIREATTCERVEHEKFKLDTKKKPAVQSHFTRGRDFRGKLESGLCVDLEIQQASVERMLMSLFFLMLNFKESDSLSLTKPSENNHLELTKQPEKHKKQTKQQGACVHM